MIGRLFDEFIREMDSTEPGDRLRAFGEFKTNLLQEGTVLEPAQVATLFMMTKDSEASQRIHFGLVLLDIAVRNGSPVEKSQRDEILAFFKRLDHSYSIYFTVAQLMTSVIAAASLPELVGYMVSEQSSVRHAARSALVFRREELRNNPAACFVLRTLLVSRDPSIRYSMELLADDLPDDIIGKGRRVGRSNEQAQQPRLKMLVPPAMHSSVRPSSGRAALSS